MRWFTAVVAAFLMISAPGTAHAQSAVDDDTKARLLFDNGAVLYEEGRYEDAIAAWERAYALSPRPLLIFNIANAHERAGHWYEAHEALNRYRAFAPIDERPILERRIRNLENRIAEEERRRVVTPASPPPEEPVAEREPASPAPKARPWRMGPVPISLYAVGGASAIVGTVFAFQAQAARKEVASMCTTGDAVYCPVEAQQSLKKDRVSSWLADGGFGLAIGCVVAGTTVAVISKHKANRTTLSVSPVLGGARLGVSSRF